MPCYCLCVVNHPEQRAICQPFAGDERVVAFDSELTGRVETPM